MNPPYNGFGMLLRVSAENIIQYLHTSTPFRAKTLFQAFLIFRSLARAEGLDANITFNKPKLHRCELAANIPRRNLSIRYITIVAPNPMLEEVNRLLHPR